MTDFAFSADGEIVRAFMTSPAFVRGLRGPVGSGKSVACCVELFRRATTQQPSPLDGLRKTRWAVVRNTQPELRTTTIKTWLDWFPENAYGRFNWSPPFTHRIRKADLDCEVIFIALDKAEDVKKLLSLELTGAFINEAREAPKAVLDAVTMRVGRYPSQRDGGPTWSGVIMDTNAPDEDHWWAIMSGRRRTTGLHERGGGAAAGEAQRLAVLQPARGHAGGKSEGPDQPLCRSTPRERTSAASTTTITSA